MTKAFCMAECIEHHIDSNQVCKTLIFFILLWVGTTTIKCRLSAIYYVCIKHFNFMYPTIKNQHVMFICRWLSLSKTLSLFLNSKEPLKSPCWCSYQKVRAYALTLGLHNQ